MTRPDRALDQPAPSRPWGRYVAVVYLILLAASHLVRLGQPVSPPRPGQSTVALQAVADGRVRSSRITLAYEDRRPADGSEAPVVVLLHGSPVASPSMQPLARALPDSLRLLIPDLPGFRGSTLDLPDYSFQAHGHYLVQLLDSLRIDQAHLVAYSQGGGVALQAYAEAPEKVASIIMVSAIGVQEMELLGDYYLNHAIHALQLGLLWLLQEGTPHFGVLDAFPLNVAYARNFYDSDQRLLREVLHQYNAPMLIVHGDKDGLVPVEAAIEHARLVPQSTVLRFGDRGHGIIFRQPELVAEPMATFIVAVEAGRAQTRAEAPADRRAAARQPFDSRTAPQARGLALVVVVLLLALSTLVSEDLTCIGAGFLVARGTIGFGAALTGCLLGIFVGDVLLFWLGQYVGRPLMRRHPFSWFVREKDIRRGEQWLQRRGPAVIIASRFLPGTRFPTYVAAGMLGTRLRTFLLYFLIATIIWTPILVGVSAAVGRQVIPWIESYQAYALPVAIGVLVTLWLVTKFGVPLFSHRGRRLVVSRWRRLTRWEFWPPWVFYIPVVVYILYLAVRHRSLTVFTAANPAIPAGGFVGESKAQILNGLRHAGAHLAPFAVVEPAETIAERQTTVAAFQACHGLAFPIVLKPDVGERGADVAIVRSHEEVEDYLAQHPERTIVQAYAPGREFGVFYARYPDEPTGHIFAITDKRFPAVVGDGHHTLERLILDDDRAVCMAPLFLEAHQERLFEVPAAGEQIQLVEIGTHCRGSLFLDGTALNTPALETAIDRISQDFEGFYFGRYDIRTPSVAAFQEGRAFTIVELNGVTSEATNLYDPRHSIGDAYRILLRQWRMAFEIGARNVRRGVEPASLRDLIARIWRFKGPYSTGLPEPVHAAAEPTHAEA